MMCVYVLFMLYFDVGLNFLEIKVFVYKLVILSQFHDVGIKMRQ